MSEDMGFPARRAWCAFMGLAIAGAGVAQAQTMDFGSCVRIEDLSARLACYDRAAGRQPGSATAAPPAAPVAPAVAPAAPVVAPAPAAAPTPAVAPAAADPAAGFGTSSRSDPLTAPKVGRKEAKEAEAELPRQIEARVTAVRTRPTGEQVLTLDNGQVWEQTESRREPRYEVGDVVVIRRGMLGSFMVTLAKGSATTRIRRIS
jgi:hypothetical protein